jgi:hypothetical protein
MVNESYEDKYVKIQHDKQRLFHLTFGNDLT